MKRLWVILLFNLLFACTCFALADLRFNANGTFRIVQFTDVHAGEGDDLDVNTVKVLETVLAAENPDLVVITGDLVSGYAWDNSTGWFAKHWSAMTSVFRDAGVRWAYALGNHDPQADLTGAEIVELDMHAGAPFSLTQMGPANIHGSSNYVLPVLATDGSAPVTHLWFMDTNIHNCEGVPGWGCTYPDQIAWYEHTSEELEKRLGARLPALAFMHIPMPEVMSLFSDHPTHGNRSEPICCFSVNTGLYAALRDRGEMQAVFFGHDHNNDFFGSFYNITLAYGRKTGYGGYGPPPGWLRGARVIELQQAPFAWRSWVRQEDGSRLDVQPLHTPRPNDAQSVCCDAQGGPAGNCSRHERAFRHSRAAQLQRQ